MIKKWRMAEGNWMGSQWMRFAGWNQWEARPSVRARHGSEWGTLQPELKPWKEPGKCFTDPKSKNFSPFRHFWSKCESGLDHVFGGEFSHFCNSCYARGIWNKFENFIPNAKRNRWKVRGSWNSKFKGGCHTSTIPLITVPKLLLLHLLFPIILNIKFW